MLQHQQWTEWDKNAFQHKNIAETGKNSRKDSFNSCKIIFSKYEIVTFSKGSIQHWKSIQPGLWQHQSSTSCHWRIFDLFFDSLNYYFFRNQDDLYMASLFAYCCGILVRTLLVFTDNW